MIQAKKEIKVHWYTSRNHYRVTFDHTPTKTFATPITEKSKSGVKLAEQWVKLNEDSLFGVKPKIVAITLKSFAKGFFDENSIWADLHKAKRQGTTRRLLQSLFTVVK